MDHENRTDHRKFLTNAIRHGQTSERRDQAITQDPQREGVTTPQTGDYPDTLADDILYGAAAIAEFLFGEGCPRRRIFHLASLKGRRRLPVFRVGGSRICARKSSLLAWVIAQETE